MQNTIIQKRYLSKKQKYDITQTKIIQVHLNWKISFRFIRIGGKIIEIHLKEKIIMIHLKEVFVATMQKLQHLINLYYFLHVIHLNIYPHIW